MATPPDREPDTKNPGGLAGRTGVQNSSALRQERVEAYSIPMVLS